MIYTTFILLFLQMLSSSPGINKNDCVNPFIDSISVVECINVVDGDTWKFRIKNDIISVRILNIDCFETKNNKRLKDQANKKGISVDSALYCGRKAKSFADSLLSGKNIKIVRDFREQNFDMYNRLLRRCFINDSIDYSVLLKQQGITVND